jgi:hypothetical protein
MAKAGESVGEKNPSLRVFHRSVQEKTGRTNDKLNDRSGDLV